MNFKLSNDQLIFYVRHKQSSPVEIYGRKRMKEVDLEWYSLLFTRGTINEISLINIVCIKMNTKRNLGKFYNKEKISYNAVQTMCYSNSFVCVWVWVGVWLCVCACLGVCVCMYD